MIPEKLHDLIPLYVMGELDAGEAAELEAMMVRSSEIRAEVRACTEALAAVATESAVASVPSAAMWAKIEKRIGAPLVVPARTLGPERIHRMAPAVDVVRRRRPVWVWPAAAAILVALNLVQFWWSGEVRSTPPAGGLATNGQRDAGGATPTDAATGIAPSANTIHSDAGATDAGRSTPEFGAADGNKTEHEEGARALAEKYDKLEKEYRELSEVVVPMLWAAIAEQREGGTSEKTVGGLTTMELRGAANGQRQAITGMWDRVRELVPDSGVAVMPDRWRLAGGVELDPSLWTEGGTIDENVSRVAPGAENTRPPFAMALINSADGLGYLDLYNVPEVSAGEELRLWMQYEGQTDYTAVGTVPPSVVGGSGGLAFRVPPAETVMSRFIITIEPVGQSPQPTGSVVIEGP